jgi:GH25 family lysozyme M1 (1,4-beta-N-acetylmuramidase)
MWQYGWHGRVAGIKGETGEVDLDVFNGTPQMLADLASRRDDDAMLALR